MSNPRKVTFGLSVVILGAIVAAIPFAIPALALHRAKSAAWRTYDKSPLDVRENMNVTPTRVELPRVKADPATLESVTLGGYLFRIPRPESRTDRPSAMVLVYPRFEAVILEPEPLAAGDALARSMGFTDYYDYVSTANHTRLDDLDRQGDLPSIQRHTLLIQQKMTSFPLSAGFEEFDRKDMKGFIMAAEPHLERVATRNFVLAAHVGFGVIFESRSELTLGDVRGFLAVLQIEPAPQPPASAP